MRRISLALAAVVALVPATLGLTDNSSFAESVPTRVPASAQVVSGADDDRTTPVPTPAASTTADHPERPTSSGRVTPKAGEDGGDRGDRPRADRTSEPGDDHRQGSSGSGSGSGSGVGHVGIGILRLARLGFLGVRLVPLRLRFARLGILGVRLVPLRLRLPRVVRRPRV